MQENFVRFYAGADPAGNPAPFCRADRNGNSVTVFFSPVATALAHAVDAVPCNPPPLGPTLTLLIGDAQAWSIHFGAALRDRGTAAHVAPA